LTAASLLGNAALSVGNVVRSLRRQGLANIAFRLEGAFPEVPPPRPRLPFPLGVLIRSTTRLSLADMRTAVKMLERDRRVRSVVLLMGSLQAGMASLYSLRQQVLRLKDQGKRVVGWLPSGGLPEYYLASACDEIIVPESGRLAAIGLRAEVLFLRDALGLVGIEADLEAIAEYKVTPDTFRRAAMSEPHRHMLESVLDSYYEHIVATIAGGRGLDPDRVRGLIDAMPMGAEKALREGLVDAVLYEDELPARLSQPVDEKEKGRPPAPAPLVSWRQAARWLRRPMRPVTRHSVGVVSLDGLIVMGRSRRFPSPLPLPFVRAQAGSQSVIEALRQAEANRRIAAVILHVNTPGGSALASDLIWREVSRLRRRKPVVVLMGAQATSGGYYVAAAGDRIIARPTTMTGSIGVWGGKFVLGGMFSKMRVGSGSVQKGALADLYSELAPFDEAQRARIRQDLGETYARFLRIVGDGRGMDRARVEEVARGRVWTGAQALEIGLVDQLGDFETALEVAQELAGIDTDREAPVVGIHSGRRENLPLPYPADRVHWDQAFSALRALAKERVWALSPWTLRIEG